MILRTGLISAILLLAGCGRVETDGPEPFTPPAGPFPPELADARARMVEEQVKPMGVTDERVLGAFLRVERHLFLPVAQQDQAYLDRAVRRPDGEVLTAPDLSAAMLQCLDLGPESRVLECGTRSGWMTALLAAVSKEVCTVDARPRATEGAKRVLGRLGVANVRFRNGDPAAGWPEEAPFDAVVLNGVVRHIPKPLYGMLSPGGRILAPVGEPDESQTLILSIRGEEEPVKTRPVLTVRFGPLAK